MNKQTQLQSLFSSSLQDDFVKMSLASDLMKIVESPTKKYSNTFVKPLGVAFANIQNLHRMGLITVINDSNIKITASGKKILEHFIFDFDFVAVVIEGNKLSLSLSSSISSKLSAP